MKRKTKQSETEYEKELRRAYFNSFLSPEKDQHIPLEDDSYFERIYGKDQWAKTKAERAEKDLTEKKKLGLI